MSECSCRLTDNYLQLMGIAFVSVATPEHCWLLLLLPLQPFFHCRVHQQDACVTVAIKLCTRSMQNSLEAVKVAYAACTAGAHLPAAEWALSNAELLMTETIRRVRLALNLCKLAHTQHPTSIPVPQPAAAGSHDDSCLDTACSSCSPQKQTLFGHAEQQTQDAAVQAQMILLQIQQLQQQLSRRRQNMQQGPQPGELLQQQPDRAQCLTQAAQAQQWLQKQELQSALPLLAQQAVAAAVVHQDEVASSWE